MTCSLCDPKWKIIIDPVSSAFENQIADDLAAELGVRKQDVFISLIEVNKGNWSFGNGEMQYGPT
jgi:hypothetical protein